MSTTWKQKAIGLIILGPVLLIAFVMGLFVYMGATATPMHPDPAAMPSVSRRDPPPRWADTVKAARQAVRTSAAGQNLPGVSVAVAVGGEIVWAEGFGWADLENRVSVAPETRFRIGTASNVLTAAGIGLLLEDRRLSLEDEIHTLVPAFPQKQWPVTVRHLMAHTAGVRNDGGDEGPLLHARCERTLEALPHFAERPLLFEPGTDYRYSTYGWVLLSAAVEAAAREPFVAFMRRHVFEPLGMSDTGADFSREPARDQAAFYFPRFAADPRYGHDGARQADYSCFAGAGAFLSTPSDLVRFAIAMDRGGLLRADTVSTLQTPQRLPSGEETGYGLGWDLETVTLGGEQVRVIGHDGTLMGGMVASLMTFPDREIIVAVTSNIPYADTFAIGRQLAEAFAAQAKAPGDR